MIIAQYQRSNLSHLIRVEDSISMATAAAAAMCHNDLCSKEEY
jgi:hypothetical protein